jgi:transglutaminase-like putative cysteine protease
MVFALRNLGLGLAAFAVWPLCMRLACIVSFFLILFAVSLTSQPAVLWLLGFYSTLGSVWLMLVYWTSLRRSAAAAEVAVLDVQSGERRTPWLAGFLAVSVVSSVLAIMAFGPQRAARVMAEWLPTSGGTGGYDPFARGGINDGDDEVRGENARSTGMVETNSFLDSPLPSLYDMFNEMYGEPFKPKERERAIALDGQSRVSESKKKPADNLRPSREFETARKGPRQPRDPSDRAARALFEVEGRTPLHIRVTAFYLFDRENWNEAPINLSLSLVDKERNSNWMMNVWERGKADIFAENERHWFRIATSLGSLVPTPPHLVRFRVGRVDQSDFFAWDQDRILRMSQRKTPAGVTVETESRTVDPKRLSGVSFPAGGPPANLHPDVAALAHQWANGAQRGWPQINAIVQQLRSEYTLDPAAHSPEGCQDPLGHFLLHARRGPDYQFASAATLLLRVLGYQTRLISGFYVSPEHYDAVTRHTPVVRGDLHFWAEVALPSGDWLVIEPTPGYEVLGPNLPWSERALAMLLAVARWLWEHIAAIGVFIVFISILSWKRRELLDALAVTLFRLLPASSWRRCVQRVLWLLERRGRWAGCPRATSQTTSAWLRTLLLARSDQADEIQQLTRMAEWCAYAPELTTPWHVAEVQNVCRRVLDTWTLRRWRAIVNGRNAQGESS